MLEGVVSGPAARRSVRRLVARLDHFGFLSRPRAESALAREAAALGFGRHHRSFPSTILARELAGLLGRDAVPMTIFKAESLLRGDPVALEVLMPQDVGDEELEEWHRRGIGSHLAFRLTEAANFAGLQALLAPAGFTMAAFMAGAPELNPTEGIRTAFFDGRLRGEPVRLEFLKGS